MKRTYQARIFQMFRRACKLYEFSDHSQRSRSAKMGGKGGCRREAKNYCISWPIRRTVNFSLEILEKNNDECILILVIYWKKTGLLHTKLATII